MRGFLWSQGPLMPGAAKVSWKLVCVPKSEGGLGIRRIGYMNKALMASHLWSIITKRKSLWVEWIYSYRLRERSIWNYKSVINTCYSWRNLYQLRLMIRDWV
jgi:hypothetical protein